MKRCNVIRVCDILLSAFALTLLTPLFIILIILLKLTGEGKVFYLQPRVGHHGKMFLLIKFATMLANSSQIMSGTITIKGDPRILPVGRFLRKTKINELPQLVNVLLGQMSIIGPRPLTSETFDYYNNEEKKVITSVRPGLSGAASIVFNNEESIIQSDDPYEIHCIYKNELAPLKGALEIWFVDNINVLLYFKLILTTLAVLVFRVQNPEKLFMPLDDQKEFRKKLAIISSRK